MYLVHHKKLKVPLLVTETFSCLRDFSNFVFFFFNVWELILKSLGFLAVLTIFSGLKGTGPPDEYLFCRPTNYISVKKKQKIERFCLLP
jgi:hypothetical protein